MLTSLSAILLATAASAAEPKFYIGSNIGSMSRMFDTGSDIAINMLAKSLFVGIKFDSLRFEIDPTISYSKNAQGDDINKIKTTNTDFGLAGTVYYDLPKSGFMTPFVGVSAGVKMFGEKTDVPGMGVTRDDDGIGYSVGVQGGISLSASESWNFDIALAVGYVSSTIKDKLGVNPMDVDTTIATDVSMKLRYTF